MIIDSFVAKSSENIYNIIDIFDNHTWKFGGMIILDSCINKYVYIFNEKKIGYYDSVVECLIFHKKNNRK